MNRSPLVWIAWPCLALLGMGSGRLVQTAGRHEPIPPMAQPTMTHGSPTPLPPLDPNPVGGPVAVGTPLSAPAVATDAISAQNAGRLELVAQPEPPEGASEGLRAFIIDGSVMLTTGGIRSARDGGLIETVDVPGTGKIAFTPDGRYVLVVDGVGGIGFWDRELQVLARRHFGGGGIDEIGFAADGAQLAVVRYEDRLHVWDVATGALLRASGLWALGVARPGAINPHTGEIAFAGDWQTPAANVKILDLASGAVLRTLPFQPGSDFSLEDLTWSPVGGGLVAMASDGSNFIMSDSHSAYIWWAGGSRREAARPQVNAWRALAWRPDGDALAIAEHRAPDERAIVTVWSERAFQDVAIESAGYINGLSWSPDGTLLALGWEDWDAKVYQTVVWDAQSRRVAARLPNTTDPRFSPDGSRLVVADRETGGIALYGIGPPPDLFLPAVRRERRD